MGRAQALDTEPGWGPTPVVTLIVLFLALYLVHLGLDEVGNPRLRTQG